ncbi:probable LINE-1 retrotransposable element ORF2 protein at N-terminal half [Coccomyxa sp. Obi]|nr:probable LINE-1 retrotransposable element ORF2 protein at N-terminal half [Coccomyxa sp. Obi]
MAIMSRQADNVCGIVWQYYGEQSTFWFHHLAKERQSRTEIKALRTGGAPDSLPVLLDTPAGRNQGSTLLRDFYSGDSATGLFAARPVSQPAQAELLEALDKSLTPEAAATAEEYIELEAALRSMPRGKAPGLDGIPYECYQRFWPLVGGELTAVLQDAFTSPASPALPPSMLQGRIILLYKGKGADRASPASYRPITLLNTDCKLAARTVASRLGPVLNQVVDPTQTGFLPKRWCMAAVGFGAGAQRWVRILHTGTTARVAFNGWHTDAFPFSSGVLQGSPLSPLLFVLATQPMAAHGRRRAQQQAFQPIRLPSGDLGVPLSRQPGAAATALYSAILRKVEVRIARWSGFRLSLLGRAYVAKQLLASMVTYHATFIPVPSQLEKRLCTALHTFVAANRPVLGGTSARLYPGKDTCFHAVKDGGIALVDLRAQILALQAKVVSRLLEPEQLAWKAFFDFWLYRSTAWQTAQEPRPAAHHQHIWQLGRFLPFSAFDAQRMQASLRVRQYVYAYQKLQPHRLSQPDSLECHEDPGGMVFSDWWLRHNPPSLRGRPPSLRGARLSRPAGGTQEMRAGGACLWGARPQELGGEASAPQGKELPRGHARRHEGSELPSTQIIGYVGNLAESTSGVLSDWLRGCDPKLSREEFTARWCHRNVLCAVGEGPDAQLSIPWSAQHPVPLPA